MSTHTNREFPVPTTTSLHGLLCLLLFFLVLVLALPPAAAQLPNALSPPPPGTLSKVKFDKSMAIVLVVLVVVFFLLGFLSLYTRHCAERRMRGRFDLSIPVIGSGGRHRGLDPEIIDTFPTFVYSAVKGQKIGRATLECAVCLNEFHDDETLRLIPKCNHVFHPDCVDAWLVNHSTCPVCRANLIPTPGEMSVAVQIPEPESNGSGVPEPGSEPNARSHVVNVNDNGDGAGVTGTVTESPKVDDSFNQSRPPRSRSTGFKIGSLFPRSHSTGHSLVQPGESLERFTLRLPEDVRNRLLLSSTPMRTASHGGAALAREGSVRRGYRTRSVGGGRSYLQYERFGRVDRRGFNWTPPFLSRADSTRSPKGSTTERNKDAVVEIGERSSDRLYAGGEI